MYSWHAYICRPCPVSLCPPFRDTEQSWNLRFRDLTRVSLLRVATWLNIWIFHKRSSSTFRSESFPLSLRLSSTRQCLTMTTTTVVFWSIAKKRGPILRYTGTGLREEGLFRSRLEGGLTRLNAALQNVIRIARRNRVNARVYYAHARRSLRSSNETASCLLESSRKSRLKFRGERAYACTLVRLYACTLGGRTRRFARLYSYHAQSYVTTSIYRLSPDRRSVVELRCPPVSRNTLVAHFPLYFRTWYIR